MNKLRMKNKTKEFLRESNAIEGVFDDDSLQQAIYAWEHLVKQDKMTSGVILKTHKILMLHHLVGMDKGYFRREPVWIGGNEAPKAVHISTMMRVWCEEANATRDHEKIKLDHIEYERIHPFIDGNGRTGRMFMNWQRARNGLPIAVIKESRKHEYYKWFTNNSK